MKLETWLASALAGLWRWMPAIAVAGALSAPALTSAQACPAGRSCFYVPPAMVSPGGPEASLEESELWLSVQSGTATGTYVVDGGAPVSFSVTSATPVRVPLALTAMQSSVGLSETRGVFVVSDRSELLVEHKQSLFRSTSYTEGYSETIQRSEIALGTRFRLGGYRLLRPTPVGYAPTAQYVIVTAPTGARVTFTAPPGATLPYWASIATASVTITVPAGQSMTMAASALLDGALVTADAPIAVSAGGRGWSAAGCGDNGLDALVPTTRYGTEFAVRLPTGSSTPESNVSVIADVDATQVRVNGALVATLAAGQAYSFAPTAAADVLTSAPVLVWLNGVVGTCELDTATIPPLSLAVVPFAVTFNASFAGEAVAVVPTASRATLTLDAAAITTTSSATVPTRPDLTIISFNITAGTHRVAGTTGFQLLATSAGAGAGVTAYFGPFAGACGDGVLADAEHCDDGNGVNGDGCSSTCDVEAGYVCRGARSVCAVTCGDGVRASTEACDDGNRASGDGCSATCAIESGWSCTNPGTTVFVARRGLTDCRESATIAATPFAPSDAVPAIGAGRWRARYVGGIVQYAAGALYSAGYFNMTQSGGPTVLLSGGCTLLGAPDCATGPRTSAAAELAYVLSTPRAEIYDFTSLDATTSVAFWDNGCFNNSNDTVQYRFDTMSECVPNDFCQYEFRAPASASYLSGSDLLGRAPSVLFDGANLLPAPVRPNSVYRGTGLTDTLSPRVGSIVRFNFAGPRTLSDFYLWQNYNPDTEGLTQFGLTFRAADGTAIGAEHTFMTDDCDCTRVPSERFTFPAVSGAASVDLRIIATENGSFTHLMEVLFGSAPICNDGNVCTTDSCSAGACSAVGVPAGTTGLCADGDACSGDPTNLCVGCATIGNCSGETPYCNMMTNECVGCVTSADCNDSNECTADVCTASTCANTSLAAGTGCATGVCNGAPILPMCVSCLTAADCADTNPCTTEACIANNCALFAVEPGTPGMCADSNVCSGPMGTPVNTCVECVTDAQCSGARPLCDTAANACVACMGDFGADGLACPMDAPLCTSGGTCIRCTSNTDCAGNTSGPLCDLMTGSCGTACNGDTDCTGDEWCTSSRVCSPTVPNGMPIPEVGPANGMCTPTIGMRVCISEVCFEADDLCGLPNGEPCTGVSVCRSSICAPNGLCAECDTADDCDGGRVCNVPTGTCVMTDAGVMNDGGVLADAGMLIDVGSRTDTGRSDAGEVDGGIIGIDAGRVDAGDTVGGLTGGACGCAVNTDKSARGLALMLGVLAMLVVRRRRAR